MNSIITVCPYCKSKHRVSVIERLAMTKFKCSMVKYTMVEYQCDRVNRKFENEGSMAESLHNLKIAISKL